MKKEEKIPEYVECVKELARAVVGKIYKTDSNGYVTCGMRLYGVTTCRNNPDHQFKPSTKEAYDKQQAELNKPKFKVNKWYKVELGKFKHYVKFDRVTNEKLYLNKEGYIANLNKWDKGDSIDISNITFHELLTDLSEIQQYLPDGHLDKITEKLTINNLVKDKIYVIEGTTLNPNDIFIKKDQGPHICIRSKYYYNRNYLFNDSATPIKIRLANSEEIEHLEQCIKDNKYIEYNKQMTKEEILEKAKRDYPVGTVFKSALKNDSNPATLTVEKTPYLSLGLGRLVVRNGNHCGFLYDDGKWAEIVSKPESTPINTYGLYVGMQLPVTIINKWVAQGNNYYKGSHGWIKETGGFFGDRKILSFKELNGIIGFEISGTLNLFLKAEGFKEFMDNFNKSKVEEEWIPEVGDWIIIINSNNRGSLNKSQLCQKISRINVSKTYIETKENPGGIWYIDKTFKQEFRKALPHEIPVHEYDVSSNSELPEKWCIRRVDKENSVLINNYFNKGCNNNSYSSLIDKRYLHFPNYEDNKRFKDGYHADSNILKGYTEITFEQFKRLVLKENSMSIEIKTVNWTPESNSLELPYKLNQIIEPKINTNNNLVYEKLVTRQCYTGKLSLPVFKKQINLQIIKIN